MTIRILVGIIGTMAGDNGQSGIFSTRILACTHNEVDAYKASDEPVRRTNTMVCVSTTGEQDMGRVVWG